MEQVYDRTAEDLGNIVFLEHINTQIPDQIAATTFYVSGLGLTRDPYLMTGVDNMWVNVGRNQFHLPTGAPQVLRGHAALVIPDREALLRRLAGVRAPLEGTLFSFREHNAYVEATSPWGNRLRCFEPGPEFGQMMLGLPYVEVEVPLGTAEAIARFYREMLDTKAAVAVDEQGRYARIQVGPGQSFHYRETEGEPPPYDGHHLQIYIADFAGPHRRLGERGLVFEESDQHQYRFKDIIDLDSGRVLYTLEHEVRSMRHPLFNRPLVNRNPYQTNRRYAPGRDAWPWALPLAGGRA